MSTLNSPALIYENALPPRAPFCGLAALSELAEELEIVKVLASRTLLERRSVFQQLRGLLKTRQLPKRLDELASNIRKLARRTETENLFLDSEGMSLSVDRIDATYNTLLGPLINLTYILESGGRTPPRRMNKQMMALVIGKLRHVISELGTGMRSDLSYRLYQRTLHVLTRLERAEEEWGRTSYA